MLGDITFLEEGTFGNTGTIKYVVASGTAASIKAGEPVLKALGAAVVTAMATNKPVVATDYLAGIAASTSTETATAAGTVEVYRLAPGVVYLIDPKVAATFDTQAEYDALVGARVLLDLTSTKWTILAADGATYGCVIMPLDIAKHPGKVAFSFRAGCSYLA